IACQKLGKEPKTAALDPKTDPVAYVISANLRRRHLNSNQRAMAAAKLANCKRGENQHSGEGVSIETSSQMFNVSRASTTRCKKVLSDGVPDLVQMVEKDQLAASVAEEVTKLTREEQTALVKKGASAVRKAVKDQKENGEKENSPALSDKVDKA